jgi:hypothetical protein
MDAALAWLACGGRRRLCVHAHLYGPEKGERQMFFENLHHLQAIDVLVLDRYYLASSVVLHS